MLHKCIVERLYNSHRYKHLGMRRIARVDRQAVRLSLHSTSVWAGGEVPWDSNKFLPGVARAWLFPWGAGL